MHPRSRSRIASHRKRAALRRGAALLWIVGGLLACDGSAPEQGLARVPPLPADLAQYDQRAVRRIEETAAALEQDLDSADAWARLGMVYEGERLRTLAIACYREARGRAPQEPRWWYRSAICHWRQGEVEEAARAIERTLELAPSYAPAHFRRGTFALETGDLDGALGAFERAIELDQDYFGGWLGKARALLAAERPDEALVILERLRGIDAQDRSVASVHAAALREVGRAPQGQASAAGPVEEEVGPNWRDPWEDEVRAFRQVPEELVAGGMVARGKGLEALPLLERLHDEKPTDVRTLMQLGEAYAQAERIVDARRTFREVVLLEPTNLAARLGLARLRLLTAEREVAMQLLNEILAIDPDYGPALFEKASLLYGGDQFDAAIPVLEHALRLDQRNPELWSWLAWSQLTTGRWQDAEASFLSLLERAPERGEAWLGLAKTRLKLRRFDDAEQALVRAEALDVETPGLLKSVRKELERGRSRAEREPEVDGG